jgi:parallel beta-helix repeat protein
MRRLLLLFFIFPNLLFSQTPEIILIKGLTIKESCRIKPGTYALSGDTADVFLPSTLQPSNPLTFKPVITISGENLVVDFQNAELDGAALGQLPNTFFGLAILIKGKNITLKNARAHGYKVALLADGVENLTLENCDFSYNYRPRLRSMREREDFSDWLSYHHNDKDEWLRYGAGIYLKNCVRLTVINCRATGNQNALLMTGCTDGLVYNNTFHFNSGLGIGLYRSSRNRVMHNRLDWNVRGYSHGFYQRGQDSAGILVYEQSSNNLIAFNSATHSGDGLFLWAGQTTMDTGEGGCNNNWIFGNDFSAAPTNGVEVTFSRNRIQGNYIADCTYGIWGGYSHNSLIFANMINNCRTAIAIEHGQNDTILQNFLQGDSVGIQLWARETQPSDWGYAQKRDTRSRDFAIDRNVFSGVRNPLKISASQNVYINGENLFTDFEKLLETPKPNEKLTFWRNEIYGSKMQIAETWKHPELLAMKKLNFSYERKPSNLYAPLNMSPNERSEPDSLPGGMTTTLPPHLPRGRQGIIVGEWGPFDYLRPLAVLDKIAPGDKGREVYTISIVGPPGNWKITETSGVAVAREKQGIAPRTITMERDPKKEEFRLLFEFRSPQEMTDVFGKKIPAGQIYKFELRRFDKKLDWRVRFFNYGDSNDPLKKADGFSKITKRKPVAEKTVSDLAFAWWEAPAEGVNEDKFATLSTTEFDIAPGEYVIELTSDDGARLYLDGKRLIDNWDVHEPETDEITVALGGHHRIEVEHFDAGGFSALDFRIRAK